MLSTKLSRAASCLRAAKLPPDLADPDVVPNGWRRRTPNCTRRVPRRCRMRLNCLSARSRSSIKSSAFPLGRHIKAATSFVGLRASLVLVL